MQEQIFKDLEKIGTKFSKIEVELGMPKNYLSRFKKPENKLPIKWIGPLMDFIKKSPNTAHEYMAHPVEKYDGPMASGIVSDEPVFKAPRPWIKMIEDYCGVAGITPEELIEQHEEKIKHKAAQLTKENAEKQMKENTNSIARGMSKYDLERRKIKNGF
jgi:hypothetical protein